MNSFYILIAILAILIYFLLTDLVDSIDKIKITKFLNDHILFNKNGDSNHIIIDALYGFRRATSFLISSVAGSISLLLPVIFSKLLSYILFV